MKQRQCDGQLVLSKRSSLRQPTSPTTMRCSLHSCERPSATPFKVWIRRMTSPLFSSLCPLPWLKSGRWTGQPSSGILRHTSAAWQTGLGFVLQGFGGVRGQLIDTSSSTNAYLAADVVRRALPLKYVSVHPWMCQLHGCLLFFGLAGKQCC